MATYAEHRAHLLAGLAALGWKVQEKSERAPWAPLKVPRATSPDGKIVLSFRRQSIYQGDHSLTDTSKSFADAAALAAAAGRRAAS